MLLSTYVSRGSGDSFFITILERFKGVSVKNAGCVMEEDQGLFIF